MEARCRDLRDEAGNMNTTIRILEFNESGSPVEIHSVNANEPETFTLEEFRKIVIEFRKNNKDCIIARISTPDHDRSDVLFNNYYVASEVNKLLFKYERDRRLLHRMKVRNPLNNQYIVGPVHYYKITCFDVDNAIVNCFFDELPVKNNVIKQPVSEFFHKSSPKKTADTQLRAKDTSDALNQSPEITNSLMDESPWTVIEEVKKGNIAVPITSKNNNKLIYNAYYFASDDDFLIKADIREYFRVNSMDPEEEFLFELDRTHNDLFALLDTNSDSNDDELIGWKRVLAVHMSLLTTMLGVVILLGANPLILLIAFPAAILILISFLLSILYIMVFRRDTFGSLAVRSIEEDI
ncbi:hypothetical protein EDEG_01130 [Edhazardia aedis USNM 41457]|uniref:Uncharacterized protein n=1 Tax=Edhazardia aedis (strain USNM 41457) TaxID=1003232 RepID=J9DTR0_EDHAE|nr:hypothetical protein EDEG_01130 [Edhazardia aedis USNM 41457]|eukprot:EJW04682.1 hypothetical protein EDEG_01130 [Edhazardia aedis USNM 41457]